MFVDYETALSISRCTTLLAFYLFAYKIYAIRVVRLRMEYDRFGHFWSISQSDLDFVDAKKQSQL